MIYYTPFFIASFLGLFCEKKIPFKKYGALYLGLLTFIYGFRDNIGPDWAVIVENFNNINHLQLTPESFFFAREYLYAFISVLSQSFNAGIYGVNVVCFLIFCTGVYTLLCLVKRPWLSLMAYYPYYILVVAVNYNRQSAALGICLISISLLAKDRILPSCLCIIIAMMFHQSALVLLPSFTAATMIRYKQNKMVIPLAILLALLAYALSNYFSSQILPIYIYNYYEAGYDYTSAGLWPRLIPLLVASLVCIARPFSVSCIFSCLSWSIVVLTSLAILNPAQSTVIDRLAIYFSPVLVVASSEAIPAYCFIASSTKARLIAIFAFSVIFMVSWTSFSSYFKRYWLPYSNILF